MSKTMKQTLFPALVVALCLALVRFGFAGLPGQARAEVYQTFFVNAPRAPSQDAFREWMAALKATGEGASTLYAQKLADETVNVTPRAEIHKSMKGRLAYAALDGLLQVTTDGNLDAHLLIFS
jgi:hypothetical protein